MFCHLGFIIAFNTWSCENSVWRVLPTCLLKQRLEDTEVLIHSGQSSILEWQSSLSQTQLIAVNLWPVVCNITSLLLLWKTRYSFYVIWTHARCPASLTWKYTASSPWLISIKYFREFSMTVQYKIPQGVPSAGAQQQVRKVTSPHP